MGWFSLRALSPEPGDQVGGPHSQDKAEAHAHVCSRPLDLQRARLSQRWSGSSLASQQHCPGGNGRTDVGAQWACCSPFCPDAAAPKRAWASTPMLSSSLCQRPMAPDPLQGEDSPASTSIPNRPQQRPRPRGQALAGLSLGRGRGMSARTSRSLPFHGVIPLEARKIWARLAKGRGHAGFCLWPVGPLSRTGPLPGRESCMHSCQLFPQAAHSAPKSGRKALQGGPLSGPLALNLGTRKGVHTTRTRQKQMLTPVPAPRPPVVLPHEGVGCGVCVQSCPVPSPGSTPLGPFS